MNLIAQNVSNVAFYVGIVFIVLLFLLRPYLRATKTLKLFVFTRRFQDRLADLPFFGKLVTFSTTGLYDASLCPKKARELFMEEKFPSHEFEFYTVMFNGGIWGTANIVFSMDGKVRLVVPSNGNWKAYFNGKEKTPYLYGFSSKAKMGMLPSQEKVFLIKTPESDPQLLCTIHYKSFGLAWMPNEYEFLDFNFNLYCSYQQDGRVWESANQIVAATRATSLNTVNAIHYVAIKKDLPFNVQSVLLFTAGKRLMHPPALKRFLNLG